MEENFSIERLQALVLRFWIEQKINLMILAISMVLVFSLFNFLMPNIEIARALEKVAFMSMFAKYIFFIILIIHLHLAFAKGSGSVKSRQLHLLPASAVEKFVYLLLVGLILPLTFYIAVFECVNIVFALSDTYNLFSFQQFMFAKFTLITKEAGFESIIITLKQFTFLIYYLTLQLLILGLIIFKDYAILKVFAIVYLSVNVFSLVVIQLLNQTLPFDIMSSLQAFSINNPVKLIQLSWLLFVVIFILLSALFYVSYLKFKTKELKT